MNDQPIKKQTFLQGTAVLAMATVLVKLMGFLFKVPLNNIIGEDGFGYFNTAYDVYNVLLMISTTGLPVAMSRMISQAQTLGNHAQIKRIYRTSLYVFLTIGMVGSLGMLFFCRQLSVMVTTNENSWAAIAALAPCVLLICLVSAYRGFFQGQSNMTPTSVSQIFEAVTRLVVGLGLAWLVMKLTGEAAVRAQGIVLASGETAQDYGDITLAAGGAIGCDARKSHFGCLPAPQIPPVEPDSLARRRHGEVDPEHNEGASFHRGSDYARLGRSADHQPVRYDDLYAAAHGCAAVDRKDGRLRQGRL